MKRLWQQFLEHELAYIVSIFIVLVVIGTTFYHMTEGWRILDSVYFSVTVLTTVGFGDFSPQTDLGKIFTMIFEIIGIGIFLGLIDVVAQFTHAHRKKVSKTLRVEEKRRLDSER